MLIFGIDKFMSECRALVNFIGNAVATLFVGRWDRAVDSARVRRVLDNEPVPDLPNELDATTNPLAVESITLDDEYHPHLHHEQHSPEPPYTVDDEVRRLGPDAHTHPAPVVGDASEPSPVVGGTPHPSSDDRAHEQRPTGARRSSQS